DFTMYVAQALGQQAPVMAAMLMPTLATAGVTGFAAAGSALTSQIGIKLAGIGLETGSIIDDMARNGIKGEKAMQTAALYGTLAGVLEAAPLSSWMKRTPGVSQTFRQALVKRIAEIPIQGIAEAGTEFMQTIVEQTALDIMNAEQGNLEAVSWMTSEGRKSLWDEATEAAIQGGLIGGGMGFAGGPQYNQAQLDEAQAAREAAANQAPQTEEPPPGQTFRTADLPQNEPDLVPEGDQGPRVPPVIPMAPIEDQLPAPPEGAVWAEGQWWSADGRALGNQFDRKAGQPPVDLAKINIPKLPPRLDEVQPEDLVEPERVDPRPGEMQTATEEMFGKEETEPIKAPVLVETDEGMATYQERQSKPEETNSWFAPIGKDGMGWAVLNDSEGLQSNIGGERAVFVEKIDPDGTATVRDQDGNIDVVQAFDEAGRPNLFAPNSKQGAEYMRQLSAMKSKSGLDIFSEEGGFNAVFNESNIDRNAQLESFGGNEEDIQRQYEMDEARWATVARIRKEKVKVTDKELVNGKMGLRVPGENKDISPTFRAPRDSGASTLDELGEILRDQHPEIYEYFAGQVPGAGNTEPNPIEVARQLFKGPNPKPNPKKYNFGENRTVGQGTDEDTYGVFYKGSWTEDQAPDIAATRAEVEATGGLTAAQMEEQAAQESDVEPEPFDIETRGLFDKLVPTTMQQGQQAVKGEELSPLFGGVQQKAEGPKQTNQEKMAELKASIKELEAVKEKNSGQKAAIADNYRQLRMLEKGRKSWEIPKQDYLKGVTGADEVAIATAGHAKAVRTAVLAGENVPAAVLEDYKNNGWAKTALEKGRTPPSEQRTRELKAKVEELLAKAVPATPTKETARADEIRAELDILQKNYEKKMQQFEGKPVPPRIQKSALDGIAKQMDKLDAELATLERQAGIEPAGAGPASEVTKAPESLAPALSPEQKLADRQTTAEEDIATIIEESGQMSMFNVASPQQIRNNLSVRLKHIRAAFANTKWKFEQGQDGSVVLKIANGPTLSFAFSNDLVAERAEKYGGDYAKLAKAIAKGYEFSEDKIAQIAQALQENHGLIKGSYTFNGINASHLIVLNRLSAGTDTLFHEAFHFVFKNYLRPSQRKALIEHYGNEEKAAKAYGLLAEKQFKNLEKMNAAERILYEVYDFARQMLKYMAGDPQSAADLMEAIYSGQIYEQPWLGTAALHSTESKGGKLRIMSGGPEPVLKMISREIKNSVEFEDGTTIKAELSQSSYSAALKNAMSEFIPPSFNFDDRRQLWEMSRNELEALQKSEKSTEKNSAVEVFGEEGAKKYEAAYRKANDAFDREGARRAQKTVDEMEAGLTEAQSNRLFGIGEEGASTEEIKAYIDGLRYLDASSEQALGESIKKAITDINGKTNPEEMSLKERVAYARLRQAFEIAQRKGWDTAKISEAAIRAAASRFSDPADAAFMLQDFMRSGKPELGGEQGERRLPSGQTTMFELEGGDWDEEAVRITDPETLFAPETSGPVDGFHSPGVVLNHNLIKEWFREHVIRNLFDKLEPLRYLQEVLTEQGQKLHESMDAYLKARNFSGRAGAALNKLESEYFQPLIKKLADLEMPLPQFEEIRMAIHALEANPLMFRRHVVVKKAALKKRIAQLEKVGVRKGMNVRVPGKVGVSGKVASANREAGTVTIEWLDRDEGRVRAKEFKLNEVERDSLAEAKEKMKEIDDMVAADKVPHSGYTSAEARQILRDAREHGWVTFDGEPMRKTQYGGKAMQVSALFDKIVHWKEQRLVESGLLSQEELDRWKKDYKYYTPMRGKEPDILDWIYAGDRPPIPEIEYHGSMWYRALDTMARAAGHEGELHKPNVGRGYNPGSRKPAQRRLGRDDRPTHSPTVELFADAMEVAVRSEKNRVAKTVWNLFKSLEHAEDANGKPLFIFDTPPMKRYFDAKTETVKERPDTMALRQPNVYDIWIDGEHHFVRSESRELAGLFSVLNNIGPESAPKVLRGVAGINRYIAKMATSRNPAFAIPNAVRDFLTAGIRLTTTHKELGTQILKKIPASAKILAEYARLDTAGELDKMDQTVRRRIEKWKDSGGETAFWMIPRLAIQAKNMQKEMRKAGGDKSRIFAWGRQ
ncbi:MAG TPA: hypothetical protein VFI02_07605, partial [Armatimonadota bacterium]|nr:hypothetical protein [Armatimonadota bacterium]